MDKKNVDKKNVDKKKYGRPWSEWEVRFLVQNWMTMTDEEIGKVIGRGRGGVKDKRAVMRLKRGPSNWDKAIMARRKEVEVEDYQRTPINIRWVSEKQMRKTDRRLT